jgi:hypothetical protein
VRREENKRMLSSENALSFEVHTFKIIYFSFYKLYICHLSYVNFINKKEGCLKMLYISLILKYFCFFYLFHFINTELGFF